MGLIEFKTETSFVPFAREFGEKKVAELQPKERILFFVTSVFPA
jgi:hypothetical protein